MLVQWYGMGITFGAKLDECFVDVLVSRSAHDLLA